MSIDLLREFYADIPFSFNLQGFVVIKMRLLKFTYLIFQNNFLFGDE